MENGETGIVPDQSVNAKTEGRRCSRSSDDSSVDRMSSNVGPKRRMSPKIDPAMRMSPSPCRITMSTLEFCRQKLPKPDFASKSSSPGRRMSSSSSSFADHSRSRSRKSALGKMTAGPPRSVSPSLSSRKVSRPDPCRISSESDPRRTVPSSCLERLPRPSISRRSSSNLIGQKSRSPSRRKSRSPKPGSSWKKSPRAGHRSKMSPRPNTREIMSPQNCQSNGLSSRPVTNRQIEPRLSRSPIPRLDSIKPPSTCEDAVRMLEVARKMVVAAAEYKGSG